MIGTVRELRSECLRRRNSLTARVFPVPLTELRSWSMTEDGSLAHETGRFFRVVGARDLSGTNQPLEQPLVEQSEVGILCLFVAQFDGQFHALITFKFEPGTPDGIEVAPTVQATRSNYEAAHGGHRVPAVEIALSKDVCTLADAVQREQESWFLGKVNRNRIVLLDAQKAADVARTVPESRWVPIPVLLEAALESRLLNMDLRSVLSMWPLEATASPDGLGPVTSRPRPGGQDPESPGSNPELVPLGSLSQWQIADSIEHRQRRFFSVVGCRVEGQGREVASWDQPLLAPVGMGQCTLLIRPGPDGPELLVSERVRIGSVRGPSLEARFQRGDIADHTTESRRRSMIAESSGLVRCREIHSAVHTEEGGRFRGAIATYQLGLLPDVEEQPAGQWITLKEVEALDQHGDRLSVELRTCLTMIKGLIASGTLNA
ncbi:NDP-hexose 2,3-dehydratase family protein [Streptomyces sp. NBC_01433]|uniref:NDP-hexose 2,3-dehydratase family protein n=1 Tax=Streptomyces sp. NBC_01433 TaxID=2903864 RepID=UPI00225148E1|nr:NDP-hexose 2,3-dehydratase family protein [Streptomyces sp. NBC_01433]MCX4678958.1 NDP-hexose 2,3-dehydratase family protein [Streptomyces sp. NBC_01433]